MKTNNKQVDQKQNNETVSKLGLYNATDVIQCPDGVEVKSVSTLIRLIVGRVVLSNF